MKTTPIPIDQHNIDFRETERASVERGLAAREAARISGRYVPASIVLGKLRQRLAKAANIKPE